MKKRIKSAALLSAVALTLWNCGEDSNATIPSGNSEGIVSEDSLGVEEITGEEIAQSSAAGTGIQEIPASSSAVIESSSQGILTSSSSEVQSSSSEIVESSSSESISSSSEILENSSSEVEVSSSSESVIVEPSVKKSVGCGKALSVSTGYAQININGSNRDYAIDVPENYDPNKPYKLFYTSHWYGGKASDVVNGSVANGGAENWAFFGLKRMAREHDEEAIFIAPSMNGATWDLSGSGSDHALFTNLLKYAKENLCVDEDRVFATGFSFGAMMTYSLSLTHQDEIRAVATLAAVNYVGNANSPWVPYPADTKKKIAFLGITGMSDGTCPFVGNESTKMGGYYTAALHAENNGCDMPAGPGAIDKTYAGSKTHVEYDFKNCDEGYPVKYITFDGGHIAAPTDGQTSDDGAKTWAPKAMWDFFSQF